MAALSAHFAAHNYKLHMIAEVCAGVRLVCAAAFQSLWVRSIYTCCNLIGERSPSASGTRVLINDNAGKNQTYARGEERPLRFHGLQKLELLSNLNGLGWLFKQCEITRQKYVYYKGMNPSQSLYLSGEEAEGTSICHHTSP